MTHRQTHESERLRYRELFKPETQLSEIHPLYVAPRVLSKNEKPNKNTRAVPFHGWVFIASIVFSLIVWAVGSFALPLLVFGLVLCVSVFFYDAVWFTLVGYTTWVLHRFGVAVFGAATGLSIFALVAADAGQKTGAFLLTATAVVGLLVALLITGSRRLFGLRGQQAIVEALDKTEVDTVLEQLPLALLDYFSPKSDFRFSYPPRTDFKTIEQYYAAQDRVDEEQRSARLANAQKYVVSVDFNEKDDRQVDVVLKTREGTSDGELVKLAPMVNAFLKAYGIDEYDADPRAGYVGLRINVKYVPSPLEVLSAEVIDAKTFYATNPAVKDCVGKDIFSIPMGLTSQGAVWKHPLHHSIVTARTGGGKESHLQGFLYQMMPAIASGHVRIWLCDPKPSAAIPYRHNSVMHRVAIDDEEIVEVIGEFYDEMNFQKERDDLQESNEVTPENPANILILDEASSFLDDVVASSKDAEGRTPFVKLKAISRKGRSLNFFLMVYSQEITSDPMKGLPKNLPTKLAGYLESSYETSKALNVTESFVKESKSIIFPIPESNRQNGMKYAGIFNVVRDEEKVAVRLPFVSREAIADRVREFGLDAPRATSRTGGSAALVTATPVATKAYSAPATTVAKPVSRELTVDHRKAEAQNLLDGWDIEDD